MPMYDFACDACQATKEISGSIHKPPQRTRCACGAWMSRRFGMGVGGGGDFSRPIECMELGVPPHCIDAELAANPNQEFNRQTGAAILRNRKQADGLIAYVNGRDR